MQNTKEEHKKATAETERLLKLVQMSQEEQNAKEKTIMDLQQYVVEKYNNKFCFFYFYFLLLYILLWILFINLCSFVSNCRALKIAQAKVKQAQTQQQQQQDVSYYFVTF